MLKPEFFLVFDHGGTCRVIDKGENRKNDGKLRNTNTGRAKGVDNAPGTREPGDFCEYETANKRSKRKILVVALNEHMPRGGVADQKS